MESKAWRLAARTAGIGACIGACIGALTGCGGDSGDNSGNPGPQVDGPEVRATTYGKVQGVDDTAGSGTYFWKGVPYAKPPVGALRWRAPVEPDDWGTRSATLSTKQFGAPCIQNGRMYSPGENNTFDDTVRTTLDKPVGSEDCLTLNLWRPATADKTLPVIVFIHGGSGISGYSADPIYDGANLAKQANAVVVTVNYRLGPFGFFNLPQLKAGASAAEGSGNFALLDNLQALRFLQKNAEAFGGDKGNVTVIGQSAGAVNLWALLASPLSAGLMHRAMPMSGGISLASNLPLGSLPTLSPPSASLAQANALLPQLLIADGTAADAKAAEAWIAARTDAQVAAYLRGVDAKTLLTVLLKAKLTGSGPIPDGVVVPSDPIAAFAAGKYAKIPVLASTTAEEGKLFSAALASSPLLGGKPGIKLDNATLFTMQFDFKPDMANPPVTADIIDPIYLPVDAPLTGYNARTALITRMLADPSRNNVLDTLKRQQPNVWYYRFDWKQNPAPWNDVYGAAHAYDLPFLFGNFGRSAVSSSVVSPANAPGRLALSDAMMRAVAAFARTGDPNDPALGVVWEPWPKKLLFDANLTQKRIALAP